MKKYVFLTTLFVVSIVSTVLVNALNKTNKESYIRDLALMHIEALAQGEDGTNVETCYTDHYEWESTQHLHCNSNTSSTTIYPCPTEWCDGAGYSNSASKCTKN